MKLFHTTLAAALLSLAAFAVQADTPNNPNTNTTTIPNKTSTIDEVQRFNNTIQIIKEYYVDTVSDQKLLENAIRGMVNGLDPHSSYLDQEELQDLREETKGEFSGIGIELVPDNGYLKVVSPLDNSPAQTAGIQPGDLIVRINDELIKDMTLREAINKMRGAKGTPVTLTIIRKDAAKPLKLTLVRDDIHVQSVKGKLLEPGYAYIRIASFQSGTGKLLQSTINDLTKQSNGKLQGVILDLRNNPGGLLNAAGEVGSTFLNSKTMGKNKLIVYTKGRNPADSQVRLEATNSDLLNGAPMVVLINQGSASASEIVAGALQDHKRAVIVGTNSFGKGSVQTIIPLDDKSAVKLTTALYYTPNGRSIQAFGIKPDVEVDDLKLADANKATDTVAAIKEAELKNHLLNANAKLGTTSASTVPPEIAKLAATDYQLFEAFNILKAVAALKGQTGH